MSGLTTSILLVHDDSDLLDVLTCAFEERGFDVAIAATSFAALSRLRSDREFDVIIAGWDAARGIAAEVYQWVLANRYHMRDQFVFLAHDPPDDFDRVVQGRCLLLEPDDLDEICWIAESIIARKRAGARDRMSGASLVNVGKPSLLLVEDEPLQLDFMSAMLASLGYSVTPAESGNAAIGELERADFDVILSDWYMANGSGEDLYDWLAHNRPHLTQRCVFMSAARPQAACARVAPGRPLVPKGQDSPALLHQLKLAARPALAL